MKARILLVSALVLMMSALGYCSYPGDRNGDRVCDDLDFLEVINNFGKNYLPFNGPGDCWQDGRVDDLDFLRVINNFGKDYRYIVPGEMIYIPAGDFQMGNSGNEPYSAYHGSNEFPQHWVTLSAYWIGKYEVTRGEYRQFMDAGGYANSAYWSTDGWSWKGLRTQPDYWATQQNWSGSQPFTQTDYYPVVGVCYYEAEAYCNWAGGHLPTEAQWEKAARWDPVNSHPNAYPWGDEWNVWGDVWGVQECNNWFDSLYPNEQMAPVGSYLSGASPYGCQDMAGNVYELCQDWYGADYYSSSPTNDPPGPSSGSYRVMRGGTYFYHLGQGNEYRAAYRSAVDPYGAADYTGFRLARD